MLKTVLGLFATALACAGVVDAQKVFAHFMVVNTNNYAVADWANDIATASSIGIDGFVLNINANDYELQYCVDDAYTAAAQHGNFQFILSFDLSYTWDPSVIVSTVQKYASNAVSYRWNGDILLSAYSGDQMGNDWWASIKTDLANSGVPISFAPAFADPTARTAATATALIEDFPVLDGFANWWAWPQDNGDLLTTEVDLASQAAIKASRTGPYIMGVSPAQFKELGGENDWVELADTLWQYRWEQVIQDVKPDIVEIITWNDFGESHYIGDYNPAVGLGDAAAYVDGFPHSAWRTIAQYYISWYKTGSAPAVTNDEIVFWYREYPKAAVCPVGDLPRNSQYPADEIIAMALLSSPATVTMDIGSSHFQWDAPAGASLGTDPFPVEDNQIPFFQIIRNNVVETSGYGSLYVTQECTGIYNFNFWVGSVPN